ncbi:hypothetical protein ACI79C_00470 [Geodermatophilus sp. SYSU D00697]
MVAGGTGREADAETDVSAAAWVAAAVRGQEAATVAALVPPVFAAHARVFHPAVRYEGLDDRDVSWAEVAEANRTVAHPAMEWTSITGSMEFLGEDNQSPLWDDSPALGHLPEHVAAALARVLRRHTGTPDDCWFGLSTHWAEVLALPHLEPLPRLELPGRAFWLLRGPVELAEANLLPEPASQSANLWWPADRAWFVATDIDLVTTFVGGSRACVDAVLAAEGLETAEASPTQPVTWDADTVNPLPLDAP